MRSHKTTNLEQLALNDRFGLKVILADANLRADLTRKVAENAGVTYDKAVQMVADVEAKINAS